MPGTLHIDTGREMRGGQWQALYLLEGLAKAGHRCMLVAREGAPLLEHARKQGLDARPLRLRELLRISPSFDLIHAQDARAHSLAALLPRPFVVARRVSFPVRDSLASRWKYSRASRYIAVSNYVKRVLEAARVPSEKVDVVYDGVPLPPAEECRPGDRIVALDSNDPRKGKSLIAEGARRAGVDIVFSRDLTADLAAAALFVYVSESEGLGSAALLAMSAGVPVLASAVGGLVEAVEDGVTGLLLPGNSPDRIADAMLGMLQNRPRLEQLGRNARRKAEREFTIEQMVRNTLLVYEKVLA